MATPITEIKRDNKSLFQAYEDHFRYLWTLDTTLYCEDATYFEPKNISGLDRCKPPNQVTFDQKSENIVYRLKEDNPHYKSNEEKINNWKFKLNFLLNKYTQDTKLSPVHESLFITCSWEKSKTGNNEPNPIARQVNEWLNNDFCNDSDACYIDINIMQATLGEFLSQKLYKALNESTMSIIILTRDYKGEGDLWYAKPNIYHELGYLMKHLEGTTRVLVLREKDVVLPSNIGNLVWQEFERENFEECYFNVLKWIMRTSSYISLKQVENAISNHKLRK